MNIRSVSWSLGIVVTLLAVFFWGSDISWKFEDANSYLFFPLLGLIAFSLMWTHYIINAVREWKGWEKDQQYSDITSYIVFVSLLLHPGLFFLQLYLDGYGLPPESYKEFLGTTLAVSAAMGTVAWLAFMAYEFKNWLEGRGLVWRLVLVANAVAMIIIFFHALKLGSNLQSGLFVYVWYFYGASLLASYVYLFVKKKLF